MIPDTYNGKSDKDVHPLTPEKYEWLLKHWENEDFTLIQEALQTNCPTLQKSFFRYRESHGATFYMLMTWMTTELKAGKTSDAAVTARIFQKHFEKKKYLFQQERILSGKEKGLGPVWPIAGSNAPKIKIPKGMLFGGYKQKVSIKFIEAIFILGQEVASIEKDVLSSLPKKSKANFKDLEAILSVLNTISDSFLGLTERKKRAIMAVDDIGNLKAVWSAYSDKQPKFKRSASRQLGKV